MRHADWGFGGMHFFWWLFWVVVIGVIVAVLAQGSVRAPRRREKKLGYAGLDAGVAKSGLNKSILDQGWFEFRRQMEYSQSGASLNAVGISRL